MNVYPYLLTGMASTMIVGVLAAFMVICYANRHYFRTTLLLISIAALIWVASVCKVETDAIETAKEKIRLAKTAAK